MRHKAIIKSETTQPLKKNLPLQPPVHQNSLTMSCCLDQLMALLSLSSSVTTWIVYGKRWQPLKELLLTKAPTLVWLLTISWVGPSHILLLCATSAVNSMWPHLKIYHWILRNAPSSRNGWSLMVLMSLMTEITPPNQSLICLNHGWTPNPLVTLPVSSVLLTSTQISFLTLNFVSHLSRKSCYAL